MARVAIIILFFILACVHNVVNVNVGPIKNTTKSVSYESTHVATRAHNVYVANIKQEKYTKMHIRADSIIINHPQNDTIFTGAFTVNWTVDTTGTYTTWIEIWNRTWQQRFGEAMGTGTQTFNTTISPSKGVYYLKAKTDTGLESETTIIAVDPNYNPQPDETKGKFLVENHTTFADYATLQGYAYTTYSPTSWRLNKLDIIIGNQTYTIRDAGWNDTLKQPGYFINCTFTIDIELPEGNYTAILQATTYRKEDVGNVWLGEKQNLSIVNFTIDKKTPTVYANITNNTYYNTSALRIVMRFEDNNMDYYNYTLRNTETQEVIDYGDGYSNATITLSKNLEDGKYVLELYAEDICVPPHRVTKLYYFCVDTTPPAVTITSPMDGQYINSSSITIAWNGSDNLDIDHYKVFLMNSTWNSGWKNVDLNTLYTFRNLADGEYAAYVRAVDRAGNTGEDNVSFTIDTKAPAVIIIAPKNNSIVGGVVQINISSSDIHNDTTWLLIDGIVVQSWPSAGNFTYAWNTTDGVVDGQHEIVVYANDSAGNTNSYRILVIVDNTPPSVVITTPENNSIVGGVVWINVSSSDIHNGTTWLVINGTVVQTWSGAGSFMYSWDTTTYGDGQHEVIVYANDTVGNVNSYRIIVVVDNTPPIITIVTPANNSVVSGVVQINVSSSDIHNDTTWLLIDGVVVQSWSGTGNFVYSWDTTKIDNGKHEIIAYANDTIGNIGSYRIIVDVGNIAVYITSPQNFSYINTTTVIVYWTYAGYPDNFTIIVNNTQVATVQNQTQYNITGLTNGLWNITVCTIDKLGYSAYSYILLVVDLKPPNIIIISPDTYYLATHNVTITWSGSDENLDHYEVRLDNGSWIYVGLNTSYVFMNLTDGEHIVYVKAIDKAGNMEIVNITFIIDTMPPSVIISSPDEYYLSVPNVTVVWSGSDENLDHYEVRLDNGSWIYVGLNTSYVFMNLTDGEHIVYVKAVDKAENVNISCTSFIIDTASPIIVIITPINCSDLNISMITVNWSVIDLSGIHYCYVMIDNESWISVGNNTNYSLMLPDGIHVVHVKVVDKAGNVAIVCVIFVVDTIPPDLEVIEPNVDALGVNSVNITWYGSDENLDHFEIKIDNESWVNIGNATRYAINLDDGVHTIYVKAVDRAGNVKIVSFSIIVDTSPPILQITYPTSLYLNTTDVTICWYVYDLTLDHIELRIDGGLWIDVGTATNYTTSLFEGEHIVEVYAVDRFGRFASATTRFIIDTTPPTLRVEYSIDGNKVKLKISASDSSGIQYYAIRVDNGNWTVINESEYTITLGSGKHKIVVRAYDKAGNYAEKTITVEIGAGTKLPLPLLLLLILFVVLFIGLAAKKGKTSKARGELEFRPHGPVVIDPKTVKDLAQYTVVPTEYIPESQLDGLEHLDLIKVLGSVTMVNISKVIDYLADLGIPIQDPRELFPIVDANIERLADYDILSISVIRVTSAGGPEALHTTAVTPFTKKLFEDPNVATNLFLLDEGVNEINVEGSRIILHRIHGGPRGGIIGLIAVEVTKMAEPSIIIGKLREEFDYVPSEDELKKFINKKL